MDPITSDDEKLSISEADGLDQVEEEHAWTRTVPERLNRLQCLYQSSTSRNISNKSSLDRGSIDQCLDALEALLDPRSHLTREIAEIASCRHSSAPPSFTVELDKEIASPSCVSGGQRNGHGRSRSLDGHRPKQPAPMPTTLPAIYEKVKMFGLEVNNLSEAFMQRREETLYMYSLYDKKQERMRDNIAKLEAEIKELYALYQKSLFCRADPYIGERICRKTWRSGRRFKARSVGWKLGLRGGGRSIG